MQLAQKQVFRFASTEQATARTILVAERARKACHNPTCPIVAVPEYLRPWIGLRARCCDSKCTQPELAYASSGSAFAQRGRLQRPRPLF